MAARLLNLPGSTDNWCGGSVYQAGGGGRGAELMCALLLLTSCMLGMTAAHDSPASTPRRSLPDDLWLNDTPNSRSIRQMFYNDLAYALQAHAEDGANSISVQCAGRASAPV